MSLDRLCFMLVERQKINKLRLAHLQKVLSTEKKLSSHHGTHRLKDPRYVQYLELSKTHHKSYRRIADLMNEQRPVFRKLRKETGARMKYNASNNCLGFHIGGQWFTWDYIQQRHNSYVFEETVLKDSGLGNPYAKELYGKETKQDRA